MGNCLGRRSQSVRNLDVFIGREVPRTIIWDRADLGDLCLCLNFKVFSLYTETIHKLRLTLQGAVDDGQSLHTV